MIYGKTIRIALMISSALVSASAAQAQTAPTSTWDVASINNAATNNGNVTLNGDFGTTTVIADAPTISATSTSGSISGSAVGGVGSSNATLSTQGTADGATAITVAGTTDLAGVNNGTIAANIDVFGASIAGGTNNSISGSAVGALGSLGISTYVSGTGNTPTNSLTYTGAVDIDGTNTGGAVTFNGDLGTTNVSNDAPVITAGTGNSISVSGVGAIGSLSYTGIQTDDSTSDETVDFSAAVTVDGTNNTGTVTTSSSVFGANIGGGYSNSISAAAVGATGSVSLNSFVDGPATAPTTDVAFGATVGVTGTNSAAVAMNGDLGSSANTATDAPTIATGTGNSISVAGVGASANVSYTGIQSGGSAGDETFTVTGATTITAENQALGTVSTTANVYGAVITAGTSNSISAVAVGSSAGFSANSTILDAATAPTTTLSFGSIDVNSDNDASVTMAGGLLGDATVSGGTNNSISVAGLGASGSTSLSTVADGNTVPAETMTLGAITTSVTNQNTGLVSVTGDIGESEAAGATITGGIGNSISIAGLGASGSTSLSQIWSGGATGGTDYNVGAIGTTVINGGNVTVASNVFAANIGGGVNNGISTAAVGASASTSFTVVTK
jgi:hypothetical protein